MLYSINIHEKYTNTKENIQKIFGYAKNMNKFQKMLAKLFVWVYNYYCTRQEIKRPVTKLKKFKVKKTYCVSKNS